MPEEQSFVTTIRLAELEFERPKSVEVAGLHVVLARTAEGVFALKDQCSHQDVALSEGEVVDCTLECWLHGSAFDLRTGQPLGPPAVTAVPVFDVRIEGDGDDALILVATTPRANVPVNPDDRRSS